MKQVILAILFASLTACHTPTSGEMPWSFGGHSDAAIGASVSTTLASNELLAGLPIRVEVKQGTVQLSGYVKTIRQSDVAGDLVSHVDGVKLVENNLIVRK